MVDGQPQHSWDLLQQPFKVVKNYMNEWILYKSRTKKDKSVSVQEKVKTKGR